MFTETLKDDDEVIGIVCNAKLTEEDMKRLHVLLHERLASAERPGLVIDLKKFEGYEDTDALREDMRMDISHRNDFARVAVIGGNEWMEWGTSLAGAITRAETRWFDSSEAQAAQEWARR
ncbi:MAG: STAS/SEC14 domain-containing protein [Candidatus Wenzhouxiangella sp. M2_3B_020]